MSTEQILLSQQYKDEVQMLISSQEVLEPGAEASVEFAKQRYESLARLSFYAAQLVTIDGVNVE